VAGHGRDGGGRLARRLPVPAEARDGRFLLSNVLWIIWGVHDHAYALVALQVARAVLNIREARKNDPDSAAIR
jgi:hypothetical protein